MAYLDVRDPFDTAAAGVASPRRSAQAAFERTEWQVIMLAQKEGLSSLSEPGWLARLAARLFGGSAIRRLADPRLEALRRFAVLAWHYSYALPVSAIEGLRSAGYSDDQLELALSKISTGRDRAVSQQRRPA